MIQIIAFIIFIASFAGLLAFLYAKIPELAKLPKNGHHGIKKPVFLKKIEKRIREHHFNIFEKKAPLHKLLSKSRIWILKIERIIGERLHIIRKNAQELDKKKRKR